MCSLVSKLPRGESPMPKAWRSNSKHKILMWKIEKNQYEFNQSVTSYNTNVIMDKLTKLTYYLPDKTIYGRRLC